MSKNIIHYPTENKTLKLSSQNSTDIDQIIQIILPNCTDKVRHFIKEQSKQSNTKGPTGYRWSKDRIRLCSTLYSRSLAAYRDLRDSGYLRLPSGSILKHYRNFILYLCLYHVQKHCII